MVFTFIKYTQPTWQFNLQPIHDRENASCIISETYTVDVPKDIDFETESAQISEVGYRLWQQGVLLKSKKNDYKKLQQLLPPSLKDEYAFLRKYWGFTWATYALLLRILTFKNPFKELPAYFGSRKIKRTLNITRPEIHQEYNHFYPSLEKQNPFISVIIPTLNRYEYLKDALLDLEQQTYKNFEVIIVDQSEKFDPTFYQDFSIKIKLIRQPEKRLWTARNAAIKSSEADFFLFFDDDSRVEPDWVMEHLKGIDYFNADISAGVSKATVGGKVAESYNYFRWADQFDSGNALVKRTVFEKIGLFDEQFNGMRMGDGEFGYRAFINGFTSISNYKAPRVHLKVSDGGLREMGSWDGFRPTKWLAPKPIPSVIYLYRKYLPKTLADNGILLGILLSNIPYKHKRNKYMLIISLGLSLLKLPVLLIQYFKADKIAKGMLKNKDLPIEILPLRLL